MGRKKIRIWGSEAKKILLVGKYKNAWTITSEGGKMSLFHSWIKSRKHQWIIQTKAHHLTNTRHRPCAKKNLKVFRLRKGWPKANHQIPSQMFDICITMMQMLIKMLLQNLKEPNVLI
jgi:hypothetical protein